MARCYWVRLWAFVAGINQVMGSWILTYKIVRCSEILEELAVSFSG
jgi:hypothetical protein